MPVVELDNVSRTYAGDVPIHALRDASLVVNEGEMVTITGPSGSGKSTLMNILGLLDVQTAGRVLFEDCVVNSQSDRERSSIRSSRIGFVFQSFHLLGHRSALSNVALGGLYAGMDREQALARAAEALERVEIGHRAHAVARTLSGGEKQRVAIARAIIKAPGLLLCDEPTGNLDSETSGRIVTVLRGLVEGGTSVVLVTHDPQIAQRGDRRVAVVDGLLQDVIPC